MIDILKKELDRHKTREEKYNHLRELMQILLLKTLYDTGGFKNLVFTGGTALRILFGSGRFSEDLDFSLVHKRGYDLQKLAGILTRSLEGYNLAVRITEKDKKTVQALDIKFKNILEQLQIAVMPQQKLLIRMEIDTNPPEGGGVEISLVNKLFVFTITHFDLPSLYATKLHACFFRKYTKGRDFYDLLWYLTKKIKPNFILLNSAIKQTHRDYGLVDETNFPSFLTAMLDRVDFAQIRKDVERFLENKNEAKLLNKKSYEALTGAMIDSLSP